MKTALQWLLENLISEPYSEADFQHNSNCWDKAEQMEKKQIIEAHGNKQKTRSNPNSIVTFGYTYTGEMYYDEKYKGIKPII
ncbi:hypothetical protein UFOVP211_20 [uncultured Caudovirales phage]|uniref:Uncharacterized protein n=1 Tax=uncultured Caudovirales phage TaxID=2100421 RepID=A0A6J7WL53_9CAUD|nr:hypothetical protein UFOVP211_20 [uncultured Caudovirales phage]